jgi:hypothetical protein
VPDTFVQVPTLLQAWQAPVHALLQQTPSAQWLVAQSLSALHTAPMGRPVHVPVPEVVSLHALLLTQSLSLEQ